MKCLLKKVNNQSIAHTSAVAGLAGVWAHHGLVPKLIFLDDGETRPLRNAGISASSADSIVRATGVAEIMFAAATVVYSQRRWPFVINLIAMPVLALGMWRYDRSAFTKAFNPASLNFTVVALSIVALVTRKR